MDQLLKQFELKLRELLEGLKVEFGGIRTNRPTGKLVEEVKVNYLETVLPIKQLGTIGVNPPREIVITPWDRGAAPAIAKALEDSNLGVTVAVDGALIRVTLPALTLERREELGKLAKATAEKTKIRLRTERDGVNKSIETMCKAKALTEDDRFKGKKRVQEAVDKANRDIDATVEGKVKEIGE